MVKDGYWYGLPLVLIAGGLLGFWLRHRSLFLLLVTIFFAVLSCLVLNFFLDPERPVPDDLTPSSRPPMAWWSSLSTKSMKAGLFAGSVSSCRPLTST